MKLLAMTAFLFLGSSSVCVFSTQAAPIPARDRHEAGMSKTGHYAASGFFLGGNRSINSAHLKDIRRGPQKGGVERIVFDLQSDGDAKEKAPYFQVNINPGESRVLVSLWADVTYDIDADKIKKAFLKSHHIKKVNVIPRVEDGVATVELVLHRGAIKVEAFHLAHPARIILDLI